MGALALTPAFQKRKVTNTKQKQAKPPNKNKQPKKKTTKKNKQTKKPTTKTTTQQHQHKLLLCCTFTHDLLTNRNKSSLVAWGCTEGGVRWEKSEKTVTINRCSFKNEGLFQHLLAKTTIWLSFVCLFFVCFFFLSMHYHVHPVSITLNWHTGRDLKKNKQKPNKQKNKKKTKNKQTNKKKQQQKNKQQQQQKTKQNKTKNNNNNQKKNKTNPTTYFAQLISLDDTLSFKSIVHVRRSRSFTNNTSLFSFFMQSCNYSTEKCQMMKIGQTAVRCGLFDTWHTVCVSRPLPRASESLDIETVRSKWCRGNQEIYLKHIVWKPPRNICVI